jgi:hypothetical protein
MGSVLSDPGEETAESLALGQEPGLKKHGWFISDVVRQMGCTSPRFPPCSSKRVNFGSLLRITAGIVVQSIGVSKRRRSVSLGPAPNRAGPNFGGRDGLESI